MCEYTIRLRDYFTYIYKDETDDWHIVGGYKNSLSVIECSSGINNNIHYTVWQLDYMSDNDLLRI